MTTVALALAIATVASVPPGVPYADNPVPPQELRGLEAHAWGKRKIGILYHVRGDGRTRSAMYWRLMPERVLIWGWKEEYYTRHGDTIIQAVGFGFPMADPADIDEPKATDACFPISAIRWTARQMSWRELDMAATRRANPWLHRKPGDDPHCTGEDEIDLGHLSPADQARLVLRWGREHRVPVAPAMPDIRLPTRVQGIQGPTGKLIDPKER